VTLGESYGTAVLNEDSNLLRRHKRRRLKERIYKGLLVGALLLVLYPLADIVILFLYQGAIHTTLETLTTTVATSSSSFVSGGLENAIVGSLLIVGLSGGIAIPLGVLGGIYMAEFALDNFHSKIVRFMSDVLAGVPSIVLGYTGYLLLVIGLGWGFSAMAAGITLAVLMLPYILRTSELSIRRVPESIREAAIALGSNKTKLVNRITLRLAIPGILTGIIISLGIALGETAPLLYTASFGNYLPTQLFHQPVGSLTYVIFYYSQLPSQAAINLSYVAAFLLICIVIIFNLVARVGLKRFSKI
jgi:phosphate transport system permease protein